MDGNENLCHRHGAIDNLWHMHTSANGKSLNALDLPLPLSGFIPPTSIASSIYAFTTNALKGEVFPRSSNHWSLAATRYALTSEHVDSHGEATCVRCVSKHGLKWWAVGSPVSPNHDDDNNEAFLDFQSLLTFYSQRLDPEQLAMLKFEAVLLDDTTCL